MAVTLRQIEADTTYPAITTAGDIEDAIWQRIESYIAHRFTERSVTWLIEGAGDWMPPLTPATIQTVECWESGQWVQTNADPSPFGGICLPRSGAWRVVASVGTGPIPPAVAQAVQRLAAYLTDDAQEVPSGSDHVSIKVGEEMTEIDRNPAWLGRALQHSGAADLLRPYRRA